MSEQDAEIDGAEDSLWQHVVHLMVTLGGLQGDVVAKHLELHAVVAVAESLAGLAVERRDAVGQIGAQCVDVGQGGPAVAQVASEGAEQRLIRLRVEAGYALCLLDQHGSIAEEHGLVYLVVAVGLGLAAAEQQAGGEQAHHQLELGRIWREQHVVGLDAHTLDEDVEQLQHWAGEEAHEAGVLVLVAEHGKEIFHVLARVGAAHNDDAADATHAVLVVENVPAGAEVA